MQAGENKEKKDQVLMFNKKSLAEPLSDYSKYIMHMVDASEEPGVVFPNGEINWACPCLGTAPIGPCSQQFRAAFKCFHYSESEMKGSDCLAEFERLQNCMKKYPVLYDNKSKTAEK